MSETIENIAVSELRFDKQNPRMVEFNAGEENEILQQLWEIMDAGEIAQSIATNGFFPQEALVGVRESDGHYTIIEGNRRLAAVKALLNPELISDDVPEISDEIRNELQALPVLVSTRKESWRYLGFKHVNGPQKWSSYAKAKYIAKVHDEFGIPLTEIAKQIGDRHKTVQRLYRGLMVLDQAKQDGIYDIDDRTHTRFALSHLYTGLDYPNVRAYLGLSDENPEEKRPVPEEKGHHLRNFLNWLYGNKRESIQPVIKSQNPDLGKLRDILGEPEAEAALRSGEPLDVAHRLTISRSVLLQDDLLRAKRELEKVKAGIVEGYDGSETLLKIAGTVAALAESIYEEMDRSWMERMRSSSKPRRRTLEE